MSSALPNGKTMWIRAFYDFNPEEAGYVGWSQESGQRRALRELKDGDLMLIYGPKPAAPKRRCGPMFWALSKSTRVRYGIMKKPQPRHKRSTPADPDRDPAPSRACTHALPGNGWTSAAAIKLWRFWCRPS